MRSNDVWLGAAYDFFQFTRVQIAIASILGIEPGTYNHHVGSLHIYEQHYAAADQLIKSAVAPVEIPAITGSSWSDVKTQAYLALSAIESPELVTALSDSARWYHDAMRVAIDKNASKA